ncbi:FAD-binding monooxygenase [Microtetraspora sp. NBRC 13810]|uniref:FAD-dependent oxidoreductase n=1 Tax=Microtetraspora sp. NBRC 13810 TaxID=3030990 RepID=UPI0024A04167|nr:FAD-binding monooxygenase [Microtetraspora sp. NBRC 13810]GLW05794.1 FAD-binding monooxygenase [Microtetraspora sp. NBRC 13810]
MSHHVGAQAVVLGGSIAGLLTAHVLAEAYEHVVIVDRDETDGARDARRGVPQGRHAHGLLARGQQVLEELLPGFADELIGAGIPATDVGRMRWYFNGRPARQARTGTLVFGVMRPVLEHHVRMRVRALPNVEFVEGTDILSPVLAPESDRVIGVRVRRRTPGSVEETIEAELVVDATGRGSRTPAWLESVGYPRVREEQVKIDLFYTSRRYRLRADPFHGDQSINPVASPAHPRGAFFHTLGGDEALLSLTGIGGDRPPTDPEGFLAYARSLPVPDVYEAIRDAEPLDDPVAFRFPASVRRRYESLTGFPEGLLVLGDAVCSFNPVYGQGMTVASMEVLALRRHLRQGSAPAPRAFFAEIARIIDVPWDIAAGGDLAFPSVEGERTAKVRISNAYLARLQAAATRDAGITGTFLRVAGLVEPPQALMRPAFMLRVLWKSRRPAPSPGEASAPAAPGRVPSEPLRPS